MQSLWHSACDTFSKTDFGRNAPTESYVGQGHKYSEGQINSRWEPDVIFIGSRWNCKEDFGARKRNLKFLPCVFKFPKQLQKLPEPKGDRLAWTQGKISGHFVTGSWQNLDTIKRNPRPRQALERSSSQGSSVDSAQEHGGSSQQPNLGDYCCSVTWQAAEESEQVPEAVSLCLSKAIPGKKAGHGGRHFLADLCLSPSVKCIVVGFF